MAKTKTDNFKPTFFDRITIVTAENEVSDKTESSLPNNEEPETERPFDDDDDYNFSDLCTIS